MTVKLLDEPIHLVVCPVCKGKGRVFTPYDGRKLCVLCGGSKVMELYERCFIRSIVEKERYCRKKLKSLRQRRMKGQPFVPQHPDELIMMRGAFCGTCHHSKYPEFDLSTGDCSAEARGLKTQKDLCLWVFRGDGEPTCIAYRRSEEYNWDIDFGAGYTQKTKAGNVMDETPRSGIY